jgi:RNA polymerase sigma factor (sigma-70 family)
MPPPAEGLASRLVLGPALRTQPDRRLVALVRQGYETAFEEIVRRYAKPLGRYAAAIVGPHSEDVTQDAFSKALLALRRDDAEIELRPWLFRIVRNTALNDLRDSPPSPEVLAEALACGADPAEELERREDLADLMRRLQALPAEQRAAIVMRELEGLGHEEIAAALGLSGGAARQAIYRARRALRDGLGMLLPLPLLRMLLTADGQAAAEAAGGAAGVAGAGMAVKATAATVLVAGTVGAGVALQESREAREPETSARTAQPTAPASPSGRAAITPPPTVEPSSSGPGPGDDDDHGGRSGPGRSGEDRTEEAEDDRSGRRHGKDNVDDDSGPSSDSGPSKAGAGHSGNGSGGGGDEEESEGLDHEDDEDEVEEADDD